MKGIGSPKRGVPINKLVFATEKARCAADFERPTESGLWIFDDPPEADCQTCRIGENAYVYTPSEQKLTKEDAVTSAILMGRSYYANGVLWEKED